MSIDKAFLGEYLVNTKFIVLATVDEKNSPSLRTLGSFVVDEGYSIYFSTTPGTSKVEQLAANSKVSILFQQENQQLPSFYNVSVKGTAQRVTSEAEIEKAVELLGNKNPRFKERIKNGGLANTAIYRVDPTELKVLDFKKGAGADSLEVILL